MSLRALTFRKREIPHQISCSHPNHLCYHGQNEGFKAAFAGRIGGILEAKRQPFSESNRQIANRYGCSESSVRNVAERAREAENKNIDPLYPEACMAKPRPGRPFVILPRDSRRLIRQATENRYQRRKDWVIIAWEIGIDASLAAINSAFHRAGYGRYPPRYKPQLNMQQKKQRLEFCEDWVEELRGKEHQIVFCDEMTIRAGERRGQMWITRTKEEAYHPDCIKSRARDRVSYTTAGNC